MIYMGIMELKITLTKCLRLQYIIFEGLSVRI